MKAFFEYRYLVLTSILFLCCRVAVHAQTATDSSGDKKKARYDAFGRQLDDDTTEPWAAPLKSGLRLKPHRSFNQLEFAKHYTKHKARWDKAFAYLQQTDLATLPAGKYNIDDSTLLIAVSDGLPRLDDTTNWESHHIYADIHLVISGKERIGVTPISSLQPDAPYNPVRDIIFYGHLAKGSYDEAEPGTFYVFFPQDGHRANIRIGGQVDKKIVIKVKLTD